MAPSPSAGSLALLLWAVQMVQSGVQRAFRAKAVFDLNALILEGAHQVLARCEQGQAA